MRRLVIAIALTSCNALTSSGPVDVAPNALAPPATQTSALQTPRPPPFVVRAAEGPAPAAGPTTLTFAGTDSIVHALATTEDGKLAVSADAGGLLRLWPSLDGEHEPVVVVARPAAQLAIARAGDYVAIAGLDEIGQLEVVRTRVAGAAIARVDVALARPVIAVFATQAGFLALLDDRSIARVDFYGAPSGALIAAPGERVTTIAARNGRALAIIATATGVRGRWIGQGPQLVWGKLTPMLPIDDTERVALSPDARRIAATAHHSAQLVIVDLARGRPVSFPTDEEHPVPDLHPIGFLDGGALALGSQGFVSFWSDEQTVNGGEAMRSNVLAIAGGRLVTTTWSGLVLVAPATPPQYLGYQVTALTDLRAVDGGWLAVSNHSLVKLDARFELQHQQWTPRSSVIQEAWSSMRILDERHVIASAYSGRAMVSELFAIGAKTSTTIDGELVAYEPSTRLAAFRQPKDFLFARFDPKRGAFGPTASVSVDAYGAQIMLLDPRRAEGDLVRIAVVTTGHLTVTRIRGFHPERADHPIELVQRDTDVPDGYWLHHSIAEVIQPAVATQLLPSTDGQLVAELTGGRITLRDAAGAERWTIANPGGDVAWSHDGDLIVYGGGIARIDVKTGALLDRRCGWQFGLWDAPPTGAATATLCTAP